MFCDCAVRLIPECDVRAAEAATAPPASGQPPAEDQERIRESPGQQTKNCGVETNR